MERVNGHHLDGKGVAIGALRPLDKVRLRRAQGAASLIALAAPVTPGDPAEVEAVFLGMEGHGANRRAAFLSIHQDTGQPLEWTAKLRGHDWCYGLSATPVHIIRIV